MKKNYAHRFGDKYLTNHFIISLYIGLRILTGKKHPKIKLQRLRKIRIWTFGSLVRQINSFYEVLKLEQISKKNKAVTGRTTLFLHFVVAILFVFAPYCVVYAWRCHIQWRFHTDHISLLNASTGFTMQILWFDITQIKTLSDHTQGPMEWKNLPWKAGL